MPGRDLDSLLEAVALDDVETSDRLLRLHERAIGDHRLAVPHPHRPGAARRRKLIAGHPDPARLHVVEPREALLLRIVVLAGLGLGVHRVGAPAHQQQIVHRRSFAHGFVTP